MPSIRLPMVAVLLLSMLVPSLVPALSTGRAVRAASLAPYDFVHDPSMIHQGSRYYLFSTGAPQGEVGNGNIQIRTSPDLHHWQYTGTVFAHIPAWVTSTVGQIPNLWAPDASYYRGQYQLYYAGSTFGTNNSVIGLATNATLDRASPAYHWVDRGLVVRSTSGGRLERHRSQLRTRRRRAPWLAFGSFWSGIKLAAHRPGRPANPRRRNRPSTSLAYRPGRNAVEAPFIIYRAPYYYLFVSFDSCCRGVESTYRIMVGRSLAITGPYATTPGRHGREGGGTQLLASAGYVRGPGGQSIVPDDGRYLLVFHYYDARDGGNPRCGCPAGLVQRWLAFRRVGAGPIGWGQRAEATIDTRKPPARTTHARCTPPCHPALAGGLAAGPPAKAGW